MVSEGRESDRKEAITANFEVGYLIIILATKSINRQLAEALAKLAPPELSLREIPIGELPL